MQGWEKAYNGLTEDSIVNRTLVRRLLIGEPHRSWKPVAVAVLFGGALIWFSYDWIQTWRWGTPIEPYFPWLAGAFLVLISATVAFKRNGLLLCWLSNAALVYPYEYAEATAFPVFPGPRFLLALPLAVVSSLVFGTFGFALGRVARRLAKNSVC